MASMSMTQAFVTLLADACNGKDTSMGLPTDEDFWPKFAEKMTAMSTKFECTAEICRTKLRLFRLQHLAAKTLSEEKYRELAKSRYMPIFEEIFTRHHDKLPPFDVCALETESVPQSPPTGSDQLSSFYKSCGSTLPSNLEMRLQLALDELIKNGMLTLQDAAHAESYLKNATWATSSFLEEKDLKKRAAMVRSSREDDEEFKRRRMF